MTWIRPTFTRRRSERDLADEIAQHLDEKVDELMAAGLSRPDAELAARRAFGNVTLTRERARAVWRSGFVEELWADVRYACRQLRRTPAFATAAIVTLAVGIGANTAVFSLVNATLLTPLPYGTADRLVSLRLLDRRDDGYASELDYFTFFELRRAGVFERLVSYRDTGFTLTGADAAIQVSGAIVGWDLFDALGVRPALGRGFLPHEEAAGSRVVVISHELWTARLGGDTGIVGRVLSLDDQPHTVVGVAPPGFRYPAERRTQIWTTIARDASTPAIQPLTEQHGARVLEAVGVLAPGQTRAQVQARASAVAAAVARDHPAANGNFPSVVLRPEIERTLGPARGALMVLWTAVTLVLLMACANLANMLLARAADRRRELGVRLAIGASRGRVIRQLLTENLLLALTGAALGAGLATLVVSAVVALLVERAPLAADVAVDGRVLAFTVALALVTSVLVTLPAAAAIRRLDLDGALRGASRGATDVHDRVRSVLVAGQVAVGLVLLTAAALLGSSLVHLTTRDPGFRPANLLAFSVSLPDVRYRDHGHVRFTSRLLERVRELSGVQAAAGATPLPLAGDRMVMAFDLERRPQSASERPRAHFAIVTPGFFSTIGAPLIDGRDFTEQDDDAHPRVVIVNEAFASRFLPGVRAIGQRIATGASSRFERGDGPFYREIVGVVGNVRQSPFSREAEAIHYAPYRQMPWRAPTLLVRTVAESTPADVRRLVATLDPNVPVDVKTVAGLFDETMTPPRLAALLLGSFAAIGLLLTATGLYGLLSYAVLRRTRELGVRLALGASRARVVRLVVSRALALVGLGLLLGGVGAAAVTSLLRHVLDVPEGSRAAVFIVVIGVTLATAILAAAIPARRAASIDPTLALRGE